VEELQQALKLATKGVLALAAGGGHATPQNAAATAGTTHIAASQKSTSRGGARSHGSGQSRSGRGGATMHHQDHKTDPATSVSS